MSVGADGCDPEIFSDLVAQSRTARELLEEEMTNPGLEELGDAYTAGLDTARGMFERAESLREGDPDGRSPVQVFDGLIERHFDAIDTGIRSQGYWSRLLDGDYGRRRRILEAFRQEALELRDRGEMTYRRWNNLHYRLVLLATPSHQRTSNQILDDLYRTEDWLSDEGMETAYGRNAEGVSLGTFLDLFPEVVVQPTIKPTGIMAISRSFTTGAHPFGVTGKSVGADGQKMTPDHYTEHDFDHLARIVPSEVVVPYKPFFGEFSYGDRRSWDIFRRRRINFHNAFMRRVGDLPVDQWRMAELFYFLATHEYLSMADSLFFDSAQSMERMFTEGSLDLIAWQFKKSPQARALLPDDVNGHSVESIKEFLLEGMDFFRKLSLEITFGE